MLQIPTHPEQTIKRWPLKLDSKILEEDLYFTKEQVLKFAHFLVHRLKVKTFVTIQNMGKFNSWICLGCL